MNETATGTCVHHWVLGLPQDDVVKGRCKRCGAHREYPASVEGASRQGMYDEAASLNQGGGRTSDSGGGFGALPGRDRTW